jgi:PAS domain S-box-containing protein
MLPSLGIWSASLLSRAIGIAAMPEGNMLPGAGLHSTHDPGLVVLAIVVAILASFVALDLAGRIRETRGGSRVGWWLAGAVAMGGGIWSMHFIAMLAFQLGPRVTYDVATTVLSLVIAIVVSGLGLFVVYGQRGSWPAILGGGILAGAGIAAMHYTGMAAMRMAARLSYEPFLVGLSIAIAIAAATAALWLTLRPQRLWQQLGSAVVMGAAISGMHFTGMAAARYEAIAPVGPTAANGVSNAYLATAIGATTALLLALALTAAFLDRRFAQAQREARIIEASEARYRRIFDTAAVSIWDEDFSEVVAAIDALRARGVRDFGHYFDEHPEFVAEAARLVRVRDVNHATLELFEARDKAELLGSVDRVFRPETLAVFRDELLAIAEGATSFKGIAPGQTLGGRRIDILLSMVFPWGDDPRISSVLVSLLDVTERMRAEDALRASQAQKSAVIELALDGVIVIDERGCILEFNPAAERIFGIRRADALGREMAELIMPARFRDQHRTGIKRYLASGQHEILGQRLEISALRADGAEFPVELAINATDVNGRPIFTGFVRDVTAEREAEAQLRQAQKMESVGQLTGGVAHDFNNLLTIIIGSLDLVLDRVQGDVQSALEPALRAAESGAALVQRLLAFSRRQTLIPEEVDFNRLAADMEDLLRRTLGEDVEIEMKLTPQLWSAIADKGQVENALLNLTVNARDAMPEGGKLTIETGNVHLDDDYAAHNTEVTLGDYVMLAVTDTGKGMPPEVLDHAFEPFFTTKEVGKGTGLGLSMIYGFAKQSGGHVKIYSEVDHGTTVRLYLPRQSAAAAIVPPAMATHSDHPRGGELILVVEDNVDVRAFVVKHLRDLGYRVVEAKDGPSALGTLEQPTPIDLLLTDVIMPGGMTGRQLSDEAMRRRPDLKTLFISGYTEDSIVHQGKLDPGVNFLSKPFRRRDLALKVREALDT